MTLYARRDVLHIALPPEQGGCGQSHTRPFHGGEPAKVWSLDCPACTQALKEDPLWAPTVSEIPETPDDVHAREEKEKRGQQDREKTIESALTVIADAMQQDRAFQNRMMDLVLRLGPAAEVPASVMASPVPASGQEIYDELKKDEHRVRQQASPPCPGCGKPLRKPGQRGATPKVCPDCRGKKK